MDTDILLEDHYCYLCTGPLNVLGMLGRNIWARCINCGIAQAIDWDNLKG